MTARKATQRAPLLGQPAPDFTLADSQGRRVSLSDFRGKRVLLVFLRHFA